MVKDPPVTQEERRAIKTLFVPEIKNITVDSSKIGEEKALDIKSELTNVDDCFGLLHNMKEKKCQQCQLKAKYGSDQYVEFNVVCSQFMTIRPNKEGVPPLIDDGDKGAGDSTEPVVESKTDDTKGKGTADPKTVKTEKTTTVTKPPKKPKVSKEERKEAILDNMKGGEDNQYKLADKIGISANLANILLRELITEKLIKREKDGRGFKYLPV